MDGIATTMARTELKENMTKEIGNLKKEYENKKEKQMSKLKQKIIKPKFFGSRPLSRFKLILYICIIFYTLFNNWS